MKTIADSIKKLSREQLAQMAVILRCEAGEKAAAEKILTVTGLYRLLLSLSPAEIKLLEAVYTGGGCLTLGETAGKLHMEIPETEAAAEHLAGRALICIVRNRQLLTNRTDKLYAVKEISDLMNLRPASAVLEQSAGVRSSMVSGKGDRNLLKDIKNPAVEKLLTFLAAEGGQASFEDAEKHLSAGKSDDAADYAVRAGLASPVFVTEPEFSACLMINRDLMPLMIKDQPVSPKQKYISNGYRFIRNMLSVYDIISSWGLFFTKQMVFRKVDYKRISDTMINLTDSTGENPDRDLLCQMNIFFHALLGCLKISRTSARINISSIKHLLDRPAELSALMLSSLDRAREIHHAFACPVPVPSFAAASGILKFMQETGPASKAYLTASLLAGFASETGPVRAAQNSKAVNTETENCLNLFVLMGLVNITDGNYSLSDAGQDTAAALFHTKAPVQGTVNEKKIYINPDFSLMVPLREIPSLCAYRIMFWSQITRDDIILDTIISRASITTAQKRGYSPEPFLEYLKTWAKNGIPQNMEFQIREWSRQTLKITVTEEILIRTSHPDFFEELLYAKKDRLPENAIKILNQEYAVVRREYLDDIIKAGEKRNAVLSVFEETEEKQE